MKNLNKILSIFVFAVLLTSVSFAQKTYPKVKVTLESGLTVQGKKAKISDESVSFMEGKELKIYDLSEVSQIQAKKGSAYKWALGCGGGCLGVFILSGVITGEEGMADADITVGQYIGGSLIWTGIFTGLGAVIGLATDDYKDIYVSDKTSSILKRYDLGMSSDQLAKYNFTLAYKF